MTDDQRDIAQISATILSGLIVGAMGKPGFDLGSIRPSHVQAAVNLALALREEVRTRVP